MRTLLPAVLFFVSMAGLAGEQTFTKSGVPSAMFGPSIPGVSTFDVTPADLRGSHSGDPKLTSIDWSTAAFPSSTGEWIEMCYQRPGSGTDTDCERVEPNALGRTYKFNGHRFAAGAALVIRHRAVDGPMQGRAAGQNTVTFNYSY
jgi:hypothetical protein